MMKLMSKLDLKKLKLRKSNIKMKSIKDNSTPAIRLYNWNLITDVLKYLGYPLDYAQKSKILNM